MNWEMLRNQLRNLAGEKVGDDMLVEIQLLSQKIPLENAIEQTLVFNTKNIPSLSVDKVSTYTGIFVKAANVPLPPPQQTQAPQSTAPATMVVPALPFDKQEQGIRGWFHRHQGKIALGAVVVLAIALLYLLGVGLLHGFGALFSDNQSPLARCEHERDTCQKQGNEIAKKCSEDLVGCRAASAEALATCSSTDKPPVKADTPSLMPPDEDRPAKSANTKPRASRPAPVDLDKRIAEAMRKARVEGNPPPNQPTYEAPNYKAPTYAPAPQAQPPAATPPSTVERPRGRVRFVPDLNAPAEAPEARLRE